MSEKKEKPNKKASRINMNFDSRTIANCITFAGFALIIITSIDLKDGTSSFWIVLFNILNSLGLTLLSAGLVSILMEISTIDSVVSKAIKNILSTDLPLDSYSTAHLNNLKTKISSHVSCQSINELQKSVYKLEPYLLDLTNGLYYEYNNISCVVIPDDSKGVFTKRIKIHYKIINKCDLENKVKFGISLFDLKENVTDKERIENVIIKRFSVNGTNLLNDPSISKKIISLNADDAYEYDYMYIFERPLQKCKEHEVLLEFEYTTSQNDLTQSWKLRYPCKKTEHTITIKGDNNWLLKANAFAAFYHSTSDLEKNFKVEQSVEKCSKIEFSDWTIPGAGYVVSFNKK